MPAWPSSFFLLIIKNAKIICCMGVLYMLCIQLALLASEGFFAWLQVFFIRDGIQFVDLVHSLR